MTFTCECGLEFDTSPRGVVRYEEHLPCPAQDEEIAS